MNIKREFYFLYWSLKLHLAAHRTRMHKKKSLESLVQLRDTNWNSTFQTWLNIALNGTCKYQATNHINRHTQPNSRVSTSCEIKQPFVCLVVMQPIEITSSFTCSSPLLLYSVTLFNVYLKLEIYIYIYIYILIFFLYMWIFIIQNAYFLFL